MYCRFISYALISFVLLLIACKKQPSYSDTPTLSFVRLNTTTVKQGTDPIVIDMKFTDGDGDIGLDQADTTNDIDIYDVRTNYPRIHYPYRMPNVTPSGTQKAISAELNITIPNTFLRPGASVDTLRYEITIKDRAGNRSNTILTPPIIILP